MYSKEKHRHRWLLYRLASLWGAIGTMRTVYGRPNYLVAQIGWMKAPSTRLIQQIASEILDNESTQTSLAGRNMCKTQTKANSWQKNVTFEGRNQNLPAIPVELLRKQLAYPDVTAIFKIPTRCWPTDR